MAHTANQKKCSDPQSLNENPSAATEMNTVESSVAHPCIDNQNACRTAGVSKNKQRYAADILKFGFTSVSISEEERP